MRNPNSNSLGGVDNLRIQRGGFTCVRGKGAAKKTLTTCSITDSTESSQLERRISHYMKFTIPFIGFGILLTNWTCVCNFQWLSDYYYLSFSLKICNFLRSHQGQEITTIEYILSGQLDTQKKKLVFLLCQELWLLVVLDTKQHQQQGDVRDQALWRDGHLVFRFRASGFHVQLYRSANSLITPVCHLVHFLFFCCFPRLWHHYWH